MITNIDDNNLSMDKNKINILVIEDEPIISTVILKILESYGYLVEIISDGYEAISLLETRVKENNVNIDIVILDINLPNVDGFRILKLLKTNRKLKHIPVIMQTGADTIEDIKKGIENGAFYYLTKPIREELFSSVVGAAVTQVKQRKLLLKEIIKYRLSFNLMKSAQFSYHTTEEAKDLACFIANCFPAPESVVIGISELMINAVEHGNLDIGYEAKTKLVAKDCWEEEISKRLNSDEYKNKFVEVNFEKKVNKYILTITDQGVGFTWENYINLDPSRALDNHGRGIALARKTSFDDITYNNTGNQVKATVNINVNDTNYK